MGQVVPAKGNHSRTKDRKSTRLNSSHSQISYAVFCLKKKKKPDEHSESYGDFFARMLQCSSELYGCFFVKRLVMSALRPVCLAVRGVFGAAPSDRHCR